MCQHRMSHCGTALQDRVIPVPYLVNVNDRARSVSLIVAHALSKGSFFTHFLFGRRNVSEDDNLGRCWNGQLCVRVDYDINRFIVQGSCKFIL